VTPLQRNDDCSFPLSHSDITPTDPMERGEIGISLEEK
jgi:hypothetical protein